MNRDEKAWNAVLDLFPDDQDYGVFFPDGSAAIARAASIWEVIDMVSKFDPTLTEFSVFDGGSFMLIRKREND